MPTIYSEGYSAIWEMWVYNHKSKAAGGLLSFMDPNTPASEIGRMTILLNAIIGGTAEEERNRTLYVDFDDRERSWSSPISRGATLAADLLTMTQRALAWLLSDRNIGLHSVRALQVIREVCASNPIPDDHMDPNEPADPAVLAKFYQESLDRNVIIRQRLTDEGFDMT